MATPWLHRSGRRRALSKSFYLKAVSISFVVFFFHYWKSIVLTSNTIFESSSIRGRDYPPLHNKNEKNASPSPLITKANHLRSDAENHTSISIESKSYTKKNPENNSFRFYILPLPDITTIFNRVGNRTESELLKMASDYYRNSLDEESAEWWLHKGFERLPARTTKNPREADAYIVVGYCHLFSRLLPHEKSRRQQHRQLVNIKKRNHYRNRGIRNRTATKPTSWLDMIPKLYRNIVVDITKPHLILTPTWNPEVSKRIGLYSIVRMLQLRGVSDSNIWSVGFERNLYWQPVPLVSHILPIPYVVRTMGQAERKEQTEGFVEPASEKSRLQPRQEYIRPLVLETSPGSMRTENSIFFVGDPRPNAEKWSGCSRSDLIDAIQNQEPSDNLAHMDVRLVHKTNRLNQTSYHMGMRTSEFCLVLCGDTPSSRTLTSAIVEGCIPVRIGSRLRGFCDPPCHEGFGWNVTGPEYSHLPFEERIPWHIFPEIDEATLLNGIGGSRSDQEMKNKSSSVLQSMFRKYDTVKKKQLHAIMDEIRSGFIYGYGDPVFSQNFGDAAAYVWGSFVAIAWP